MHAWRCRSDFRFLSEFSMASAQIEVVTEGDKKPKHPMARGLTFDEALTKYVGEFGKGQVRIFLLGSLAWVPNAILILMMVFANRNPLSDRQWHCTDPSDAVRHPLPCNQLLHDAKMLHVVFDNYLCMVPAPLQPPLPALATTIQCSAACCTSNATQLPLHSAAGTSNYIPFTSSLVQPPHAVLFFAGLQGSLGCILSRS